MEFNTEAGRFTESFPDHITRLTGPIPSLDLRWIQRIHASIEDTYPDIPQEEKIQRIANDVNNIAEARVEILSADTYHYANGVARLLSKDPLKPRQIADITAARLQGELLAVPDHEQWLYPGFQFDKDTHQVRPIVKIVNEAFKDEDPWDTLLWWHTQRSIGSKTQTFIQVIDDEQTIINDLVNLGRLSPDSL